MIGRFWREVRPFEVTISVHPRRAGWGDVRIHARARSAGAAAARAATPFFERFTATRRPWMDLENIAAIFAAAAKKAHSVAATAESIQSVDFGSGVELGSRRDRALRGFSH